MACLRIEISFDLEILIVNTYPGGSPTTQHRNDSNSATLSPKWPWIRRKSVRIRIFHQPQAQSRNQIQTRNTVLPRGQLATQLSNHVSSTCCGCSWLNRGNTMVVELVGDGTSFAFPRHHLDVYQPAGQPRPSVAVSSRTSHWVFNGSRLQFLRGPRRWVHWSRSTSSSLMATT